MTYPPPAAARVDAAAGVDAAPRVDGFADRVLDVVELIPPGRVMSYGDIAEYLGEGGPRQVGRVLALWGGAVPWWRVIHADGSPPPGHEPAAAAHYTAEATPLRQGTGKLRVDMRLARWRGGSAPARGTARRIPPRRLSASPGGAAPGSAARGMLDP